MAHRIDLDASSSSLAVRSSILDGTDSISIIYTDCFDDQEYGVSIESYTEQGGWLNITIPSSSYPPFAGNYKLNITDTSVREAYWDTPGVFWDQVLLFWDTEFHQVVDQPIYSGTLNAVSEQERSAYLADDNRGNSYLSDELDRSNAYAANTNRSKSYRNG